MSCREVIEAVVQVGAEETRYLRCGRGERTVVVLAEDAVRRAWLMDRFAAGNRVIAPVTEICPEFSCGDTDGVERWLRGVIDGLGLDRPMVALTPALGWLGERLAGRCGDTLDVVLSVASG